MYYVTQDLFHSWVAIGAARAEGRYPSHDGEKLDLMYDSAGRYAVSDNAGQVACDAHGYLDVIADTVADPTADDLEIAAEIDAEVKQALPTRLCYREGVTIERFGSAEVTNYGVEIGWLRPA